MPLPCAICHDPNHVSHRTLNDFTVIHNRYAPSELLAEHEHETASVYLVLRGAHEERGRSRWIDCNRGAVIFSPAGAKHSDHYGTAGGEAFLIELPRRLMERARDGGIRLDDPLHLAGGAPSAVMRLMRDEARRDDPITPFAFEALTLQLLAALGRAGDTARCPPDAPLWLSRARELLQDRFAEPLSLGEVADAVGVHPVHLATTFQRCFRTTFGAYLRHLRVERARRALAESDKPIVEIALECGFADQSHLSRVFRDVTGSTPARYRRLARA